MLFWFEKILPFLGRKSYIYNNVDLYSMVPPCREVQKKSPDALIFASPKRALPPAVVKHGVHFPTYLTTLGCSGTSGSRYRLAPYLTRL